MDEKEYRRCYACGETKLISEFGLNRTRKFGQAHECKACKKERDYIRRHGYPPDAVCSILKQHAEVLSHDPDRLSTDFIKSLMHTDPKCD